MTPDDFTNDIDAWALPPTLPDELPRCNDKYIYDALDLLELDVPDITVLPCIYFDRSTNYIVPSDQLWADIPQDFIGVCAFENDQSGAIFVAEYVLDEDFDPDPAQRSRRYYARFSEAELLKTCLHELRHLWQVTWHSDEFSRKDGSDETALTDIAEIDADAFALAYLLSDRTPYTLEDIPVLIKYISREAQEFPDAFQARRELAEQLANHYGFTNFDWA